MTDRQETENGRISLIQFIRENQSVFWVSFCSVLFCYGVTLTDLRIGVDSEAAATDPDYMMLSWYTVSRYSLVWLKELTGMRLFNPFLENILMMAALTLCGVASSFLFYACSGGSPRMKGFCRLFPVLFLTHPCFTEQFVFTLQAFEVAFCMLACLAAAYGTLSWSFDGRKRDLAAGVILMAFGFGGYQALVPLYMAAALGGYLIRYEFQEADPRFYLRAALRSVAAFLGGYFLYVLAGKAIAFWKFGAGFQAGYLADQVYWKSRPIAECLASIQSYIRLVLLGGNGFFNRAFLLCALLFAVRVVWLWTVRRRQGAFFYAAAAFLLALSPFFLCFYQGSGLFLRSQLCLPFTAAFFGSALLMACGRQAAGEMLSGESGKLRTADGASGKGRRFWRAAGAVLAVCLLWTGIRQGSFSSRAMLTAQLTYETDRETAYQLADRIWEQGAPAQGCPVAMLGKYTPSPAVSFSLREESIGYSIFEWDYSGPVGVSRRGAGFLQSHGLPFTAVPEELYAAAQALGEAMPCWPQAGSVRMMDGVAVVKFSD